MSKLLIQSDLHQISEIPGYLQVYEALWGPMYEAVLTLLGSNGTILPIGDPYHGKPNATTFKTVGGEQVTFTWSEAPASFATSLDLADPANYQGVIPVVTFNGTDEEADSPDAAYWTRALAVMSVGAWVNMTDASSSAILSKYDSGSNAREWIFRLNGSDLLDLVLYDEDAAGNEFIASVADVATAQNIWAFVVATYDGSADASGINLYADGALVASTDTDQANFVSMRDKGWVVGLGQHRTGSDIFDGKMAGGPLGPFFTQKQLSADEVRRLYEVGRRALAL